MKALSIFSFLFIFLFLLTSCSEDEILDETTLIQNEETLIKATESNDFITIRVESLADMTDNRATGPNPGDYCNISFDINSNKEIDADIDFGYESATENYDICSYYFLGDDVITHCAGHPTTAKFSEYFTASSTLTTPHIIWELKISKEELNQTRTLSFTVKTIDQGEFRIYPTNISNNNPREFYFNKTLTFNW